MLPGIQHNGTITTIENKIFLGCNLTEPKYWRDIVEVLGQAVQDYGIVVDVIVSRAGSVLSDGLKPPGELPIGHPLQIVCYKEVS